MQAKTANGMKDRGTNMKQFTPTNILCIFSIVCLAIRATQPCAYAQTSAGLQIQTYPGLTITGQVGTVYSIEYVTDLSSSNSTGDWGCLEFLQLPASPYLWADRSDPVIGRRFYRAVAFVAPPNMVFIPPGTFRMGSPSIEVDRCDCDGGGAGEGPQISVTISRGFWMEKYEVTQANYLAVMGGNPSWFNGNRTGQTNYALGGFLSGRDYGSDLSRPVERVGLEDATNYCAKLTQIDRAAGQIPTNSAYRLPTEAEWEYACRAWTSTRFSYGEDWGYTNLTNYAWFAANAGFVTHSVGLKLPNPWGLYDMHGNVWEWCQDWLGAYVGGTALDPQGRSYGIRGGGFTLGAPFSRSADRCNYCYASQRPDIGFRVVLVPDFR
jgi:formylglycine-generating enzyme required for sulfatase activity